MCAVNYPAIEQFRQCPLHGDITHYNATLEPDEDWQKRFTQLNKEAQAAKDWARPIPLVHEVEVSESGGRYFVSQPALQRAGLRLQTVGVGDQFHLFELDDGWIYETQGFNNSLREWWVERVAVAILLPTAEGA